ncbi:MAG: rod shape-determining protein MreC, partial [Pseudomonadota bacterium]
TGKVLADSGGPFRKTVLLNVGLRDGIVDGWAVLDGLGYVGRIVGVGNKTSRVILLSDNASRVAITIEPSGQKALLIGDNTFTPTIEFLENPDLVKPGDRIVTSGDGGVLPADLLIGQVVKDTKGRLRARVSADMERLEFLRVIRHSPLDVSDVDGDLVGLPLEIDAVPVDDAGQ